MTAVKVILFHRDDNDHDVGQIGRNVIASFQDGRWVQGNAGLMPFDRLHVQPVRVS